MGTRDTNAVRGQHFYKGKLKRCPLRARACGCAGDQGGFLKRPRGHCSWRRQIRPLFRGGNFIICAGAVCAMGLQCHVSAASSQRFFIRLMASSSRFKDAVTGDAPSNPKVNQRTRRPYKYSFFLPGSYGSTLSIRTVCKALFSCPANC